VTKELLAIQYPAGAFITGGGGVGLGLGGGGGVTTGGTTTVTHGFSDVAESSFELTVAELQIVDWLVALFLTLTTRVLT
jgi:hypothetical protein